MSWLSELFRGSWKQIILRLAVRIEGWQGMTAEQRKHALGVSIVEWAMERSRDVRDIVEK